jgi:hypothetical protein
LTRRRGGIYYAAFDFGRKPVLVVSWNAINEDESDMDAQPVGDLAYPKMREVELALARALDLTGAND